jgi:hypothetical protein
MKEGTCNVDVQLGKEREGQNIYFSNREVVWWEYLVGDCFVTLGW